jgi:hypothetical protein
MITESALRQRRVQNSEAMYSTIPLACRDLPLFVLDVLRSR